jgi:hypothetical protein
VPPFSGADGDGNGVVDQADYDIWRANFGRTAPTIANASAVAAALVETDGHQPAEKDAVRPLDNPTTRPAQHPLRYVDSETQPVNPRTSRTRPARREALPPAASYDDAIVAWLVSHSRDVARNGAAAISGSLPAAFVAEEHREPSINELDLAFAAVSSL